MRPCYKSKSGQKFTVQSYFAKKLMKKGTLSGREQERLHRKKANQPPRPFGLFMRDIRRRITGHKVSFLAFRMFCANRWNSMSEDQKQPYKQLAAEVSQRLLEEYGKPVRRFKPAPKRGNQFHAYIIFNGRQKAIVRKEIMANNGGIKPSIKEVNAEVTRRWKLLSNEDKKQLIEEKKRELMRRQENVAKD